MNLLAIEGNLNNSLINDVYYGSHRLKGNCLPDVLIAHCGRRNFGHLKFLRSVRIAVLVEYRRLGVASKLIEYIHQYYSNEIEIFGTLFGVDSKVFLKFILLLFYFTFILFFRLFV